MRPYCDGSIDWQFRIDINVDENCASVVPIYDGATFPKIWMKILEHGLHQRRARFATVDDRRCQARLETARFAEP